MIGRRFTRSVLKDDTSTTTSAAATNANNDEGTMEVETSNNHQQQINNNRRSSPRRRSSQTSSNETNPILDVMSDIELDLFDAAATSNKTNNVRTVSEEQVTTGDEDDIDMEIGKLDDEQQWPSPPTNTTNSSSNNDTSHTMATYQQQYYGGSADNDKLKSYRISHLQHRISSLESQVSSSLSSSNSSTSVAPPLPMSSAEEERLKRRISEIEYELQMRRNRTNRLRKLIMDYVKLPSVVVDDCIPQMLEGGMLNGMGGGEGILPMLNEQQLGVPMLNMEGGAVNVVSPTVQMNVNHGEVDGGLDSLPELPVMNLNDNDNVEDNGSSEGQYGKKRGYAEV